MKSENEKMQEVILPMMEHICDNLCVRPKRTDIAEEELKDICADCEMGQYVVDILNTYDRLNGRTDETKSRIVWCEDCEYCFYQKLTNTYWCRLCSGIDGDLEPWDGCTRGKRRNEV